MRKIFTFIAVANLYMASTIAQENCNWFYLPSPSECGWREPSNYMVLKTDFSEFKDAGIQTNADTPQQVSSVYFSGENKLQVYHWDAENEQFNPIEGTTYPFHYYQSAFASEFETDGYYQNNEQGLIQKGSRITCGTNIYYPDYSTLEYGTAADRPSKGFVELNRAKALEGVSQHGWIEIRNLPAITNVLWSFSSVGRTRGVKFEKKVGDGEWTQVRWLPSTGNFNPFAQQGYKFTDNFDPEEENISLRWKIWDGDGVTVDPVDPNKLIGTTPDPMVEMQHARLHDIKIYAEEPFTSPVSSIGEQSENKLRLIRSKEVITLTETSDIEIFTISGQKVISRKGVKELRNDELPQGLYLIKARSIESSSTRTDKLSF